MSAKQSRRAVRNHRRNLKSVATAARYVEQGWRDGFAKGMLAGGLAAAVFIGAVLLGLKAAGF